MPSTNQDYSSGSIPSFPPPPMSATLAKEKAKRKTKSKSRSKIDSSSSRSLTPLERSRFFLLPLLLVITFTVLILGVIYAYCVVLPHTGLTDAQLGSSSDVTLDSSIFGRRDGGESQSSNKSGLTAGLLFYALASPLFALVLLSAELLLALASSSPSTNDVNFSQSIEPRPRSRFSGILMSRRAHWIVLTLTLVNITSLAITTSFWTHCELPSPSITKSSVICPAAVRGHWMGGIHEVSIAKVTVGWLIVIGLVFHAFFVLKNMKMVRRRWALEHSHRQAEDVDVTVKLEEADLERGPHRSSRVRFQ